MSSDEFQQSNFQRLSNVRFVSADTSVARFEVDGIALNVVAHAADTLRLIFGQSQLPDYGLLQKTVAEGTLSVEPQGGSWRITSGDISLKIEAAPLRLTLSKAGRTVLTSITDQHFRGRTRLPAFGLQQGEAHGKQPRRWCASFALNSDTAVYGFGEKFGPLDKRGQLVRGRTEDALGVNTELSYKNIPFCWSPDGWGLLAHTPGVVRHGVGYPQWSHRTYVLEVEDDVLDLFLFAGEPASIIDRYTALTGRAAVPPLWEVAMPMPYVALQQMLDVQHLRRSVDGCVDLGLRHLGQLQTEGHVVEQAHVRVQRITLKDHGNAALRRRQVVDDPAADAQGAFGDVFQPRDRAQKGALAAAAGADEDHEFTVTDVEVDRRQDLHLAIGFADPCQFDCRHVESPRTPPLFVENIQADRAANNPAGTRTVGLYLRKSVT